MLGGHWTWLAEAAPCGRAVAADGFDASPRRDAEDSGLFV